LEVSADFRMPGYTSVNDIKCKILTMKERTKKLMTSSSFSLIIKLNLGILGTIINSQMIYKPEEMKLISMNPTAEQIFEIKKKSQENYQKVL
jgi:hypothetical protein